MTFFEDTTVIDLMTLHLRQVEKLEESESKKVLSAYREVRRELRDRLEFIPGDKFTAQQLRGTLIQIESAILTMEKDLNLGLRIGSERISVEGINHLVKETEKFEEHFTGAVVSIPLNVIALSTEASNLLLNQKESSIRAYSEGVRAGIARTLTQSSIAQESISQAVSRVSKFFLAEEWRLLRITRTELHNVYNLSKLNGMSEIKEKHIPDLKKSLIHPIDDRTGEDSKILAKVNPIVPINKPFKMTYKGKERVFMHPPDRPNDRAILVPVRDSWNK